MVQVTIVFIPIQRLITQVTSNLSAMLTALKLVCERTLSPWIIAVFIFLIINHIIESLRDIAEYVRDSYHKWFHLGLSLGIRYATLKEIECTPGHHQLEDYALDMLQKWLRSAHLETGPPSCRSLAQALDCPLVREHKQAQKIQYDHQNLSTPSQ
jgi:hypothetical protein